MNETVQCNFCTSKWLTDIGTNSASEDSAFMAQDETNDRSPSVSKPGWGSNPGVQDPSTGSSAQHHFVKIGNSGLGLASQSCS